MHAKLREERLCKWGSRQFVTPMLLVDLPPLCNRFPGIISIDACYGINRVLLNCANLCNTKEDHTKACSIIGLGQKPK